VVIVLELLVALVIGRWTVIQRQGAQVSEGQSNKDQQQEHLKRTYESEISPHQEQT
jgi:hypothetical protein